MPETFEDVLRQVQREEEENLSQIRSREPRTLGGTLEGAGSLLRGVSEFRLAGKRKEAARKVRDYASKFEGIRMDEAKDRLSIEEENLKKMRKTSSYDKINTAYTKFRLYGDDSELNAIPKDAFDQAEVFKNPLTNKYHTLGDETPELANDVKRYPNLIPAYASSSQELYTPDKVVDFRKYWTDRLEKEKYHQDRLDRVGGSGYRRSKDISSAFDGLLKESSGLNTNLSKVDADIAILPKDKPALKRSMIDTFRNKSFQKAKSILEKMGADEQLQQIEGIEQYLDPNLLGTDEGKAQLNSALGQFSKVMSDMYSIQKLQDVKNISYSPTSAPKTRISSTPVIPAGDGVDKQKVGKGTFKKEDHEPYDSYVKRAQDRYRDLQRQGKNPKKNRSIVIGEFPDLKKEDL